MEVARHSPALPVLGNRGRAQLAVTLHLLRDMLESESILGNRSHAVTLHLLRDVLESGPGLLLEGSQRSKTPSRSRAE